MVSMTIASTTWVTFSPIFPLDGQFRLRHQERSKSLSGQLAKAVSSGFLRQGLYRRSPFVHGRVGRRVRRQEAIHSGTFMGIAPTGKRITIRYMDFWKVEDGRITDNWVMVDFPDVLSQLGVDVFGGEGWEAFDRGEREPPKPQASEAA